MKPCLDPIPVSFHIIKMATSHSKETAAFLKVMVSFLTRLSTYFSIPFPVGIKTPAKTGNYRPIVSLNLPEGERFCLLVSSL